MPNVLESVSRDWTIADLFSHFGPIPFRRFRKEPMPGCATEEDVLTIHSKEKRLYELVEGVLVEKTSGIQESYLAALLASLLVNHVKQHDLGFLLGADGMLRLAPGLIRIPDVSFIAWSRVADHRIPSVSMLGFAPDLAIEVLSPGNTTQEMNRNRSDYFKAGVRLLWYIDPVKRSVQVYTPDDSGALLLEGDTLRGDHVIPGFALPLRDLFAQLGS